MVRQDNLLAKKVKMARNPQSFFGRSKNLNFTHYQIKKKPRHFWCIATGLKVLLPA